MQDVERAGQTTPQRRQRQESEQGGRQGSQSSEQQPGFRAGAEAGQVQQRGREQQQGQRVRLPVQRQQSHEAGAQDAVVAGSSPEAVQTQVPGGHGEGQHAGMHEGPGQAGRSQSNAIGGIVAPSLVRDLSSKPLSVVEQAGQGVVAAASQQRSELRRSAARHDGGGRKLRQGESGVADADRHDGNGANATAAAAADASPALASNATAAAASLSSGDAAGHAARQRVHPEPWLTPHLCDAAHPAPKDDWAWRQHFWDVHHWIPVHHGYWWVC